MSIHGVRDFVCGGFAWKFKFRRHNLARQIGPGRIRLDMQIITSRRSHIPWWLDCPLLRTGNSMSPFLYLCGFISHLFTVSTLLFLCALYLLTINLSWLQDLLSYIVFQLTTRVHCIYPLTHIQDTQYQVAVINKVSATGGHWNSRPWVAGRDGHTPSHSRDVGRNVVEPTLYKEVKGVGKKAGVGAVFVETLLLGL